MQRLLVIDGDGDDDGDSWGAEMAVPIQANVITSDKLSFLELVM